MIIHRKLSKMKNKILLSEHVYRLGEFNNISHGAFGAERVNILFWEPSVCECTSTAVLTDR